MLVVFALLAVVITLAGCNENSTGKNDFVEGDFVEGEEPAVLYCSVDAHFATDILNLYQQRFGLSVRVIYDSEAGKTTGLVQRIRAEAGSAGADIFWSSEIFNTILLAREGRLSAYDSPAAADIPARYRDSSHHWTAFGLRARVLAFDRLETTSDSLPTTWEALAQKQWASKLALANPLFGTTRGHVAAMFALWGEARGRAFLNSCARYALVTDGNSAAVRAVLAHSRSLGMTDSDDVVLASRAVDRLKNARSLTVASRITSVYPDMGDGGTLLIPNTVAIVAGGAHPKAARKLYDFLVSADVERLLAQSDSRNIPVRQSLRRELNVPLPPQTKMSYDRIADAMDEAVKAVRDILLR